MSDAPALSAVSASLSLDTLRCFVEAARLLNFRAAASAVALTPAALGQRIRQLEDVLGARLFHRTTRSVRLTERGTALLPHAQAALQAVEDCALAGLGQTVVPNREITIGTRHELGLSWLEPNLPTLEQAIPGLTVHLYFGSGPDLLHQVRQGQLACAVTSSQLTDPKLSSIRLHREDYALVAAPGLLTSKPLRCAADAKAHTLVDTSDTLPLFRYFCEAEGGFDGGAFARVLRMGTISAIRPTLLRGRGVGVLPRYFVTTDLASGTLVEAIPEVILGHDHFRLLFRDDDPWQGIYQQVANTLMQCSLR